MCAPGDLAFCQTDGYLAHGEVRWLSAANQQALVSAPPSSLRPRASIRKLAVKRGGNAVLQAVLCRYVGGATDFL